VSVRRLTDRKLCLDPGYQPLNGLITEALPQRIGAREFRPTGFARDDSRRQGATLIASRSIFEFVKHHQGTLRHLSAVANVPATSSASLFSSLRAFGVVALLVTTTLPAPRPRGRMLAHPHHVFAV
jgi:hypothetical protein